MSTTKIPQYGDPEILPKGTVRRPSPERQPFTNSGERKPAGPGPFPEDFTRHPDIDKLPWRRVRGDEWTTPELRALVFAFLVQFFDTRDWPKEWEVVEKASADRHGRLREDQWYLIFRVTRTDNKVFEVSVVFPPDAREDAPDRVAKVLAQAAQAIDAQHTATPVIG
jgi:hypothetical protein